MTANSWQWRQTVFLAMWSIAVVWALNESPALEIVPKQKTQVVPVNQRYTFTCIVSTENRSLFSELRWINPRGDEVKNGERMKLQLGSGSVMLVFLQPTLDDSGVYKCTANFKNSVVKTAEVELIFYKRITWEVCKKDQAIVLGREGEKIKCRVTGGPSPWIMWTKDGKNLNYSRYIIENDTITVNGEVSEVDAGLYTVTAIVQNMGFLETRDIVVNVHIVPKIVELPDEVYVVEERERSLHCKASGRPDPMYSWLDPLGRNLSNVLGYAVDRKNGYLTILKTSKVVSGEFVCVAENAAGRDEKKVQLVVERPKLVSHVTNDTKIVPDGSEDTKQGQSKGEILAKACEYITELVSENSRLVKDLESRSNELDTARQQLIDQKSEIRRLKLLLQRHGVTEEST